MTTFTDVWEEIERLRSVHARHRKKNFVITAVTPAVQSNHLIEEAVELQAEVVSDPYDGRRDAIICEAADTLVVLMHMMILHDINGSELLQASMRTLADHWDDHGDLDPKAKTRPTPGHTDSALDDL